MKRISEMTQSEKEKCFRDLVKLIESNLPPGDGPRGKCFFIGMISEGNDAEKAQLVCNAEPQDVVSMLREIADQVERQVEEAEEQVDDPGDNQTFME